ncbi:putative lipoprotein with Yx(FWY)xxD motif [Bradyrhizobium liaoningense]|nr:hypothetical protein GCM10007858_35630 [Bradyrhizobium liaoningense]
MTSSIRLALALAISLAIVPAAFAAPPTKTGKTDKGSVLTDAKGMTLYTFDKDADGKSACNGPCATNWPVLKAEAGDAAGDGYTIITRDDGSRQWAYKGKPLYTFAKDQKPGRHHRRRLLERCLASGDAVTALCANTVRRPLHATADALPRRYLGYSSCIATKSAVRGP